MPALRSGDSSKILVTGANGYLAMWVIRKLLESGYHVRGSVRSLAKGRYLQEYFRPYGDHFELAIVEDITKEGALDEALEGIDAVEHIATPTELPDDDPQSYIGPAVNGTLGILKSALKSKSVKRIIYTSTTGAVQYPTDCPFTFTEENWNNFSLQHVEKQGRKASGHAKYLASKVIAERAAWKFYEEHKNEINWDFLVLIPPWILGEPLYELTEPRALNGSLRIWYEYVFQSNEKTEQELAGVETWVNVKNIADAHVIALKNAEAAGERIIVAAGGASWQDWINISKAIESSIIPQFSRVIPGAFPELKGNYIHDFDISKEAKLFGIKYAGMKDTAKEMLVKFAEKGWY